ncbi:MAG: UDP-glucose/GDP-mannose dehydrogenase family protein, partial [Candidatus Binatia bacterium]
MKVSVFGLGYVGMVNAVCLASEGHEVVGVDVNPTKVQMINNGQSPIKEKDVEPMLTEQIGKGHISTTTSPTEAVLRSQLSLICVGTPATPLGAADLTQVTHVCKQIGGVLRHTTQPYTVVIRSTVLPGTTEKLARLLSNVSGRTLGKTLHVAFNPEFLREGTAVKDFLSPPFTVVGTEDPATVTEVKKLYGFLSVPSFVVRTSEAELLKYAANAFHATKITFANEIGRLANHWGVDGSVVMDLISQDTVLNISSAYLRPGFAYGGSCLPKDLRALVSKAHVGNVRVPLLESLSRSNRLQIDSAYDLITGVVKSRERTIGFLGLAFKAGTDDLRESPMVELVERLLGKGYRLLLYDGSVSLANLMGTNKEFIEQEIPHLADLMTDDIHRVLKESHVLVVSSGGESYADSLQEINREAIIINLQADLNDGKSGRTL